jgi:hypothetical protein
MPPKKSRQQKDQSRMKALETMAQKRADLGSETAAEDLWDKLQDALTRNKELEQQLFLKSLECESLHSELETFRQKCTQLTDEVFHWRSKQEVVLDMGTDIPRGYADRGTVGTDTDTDFCIRHQTHTPTRHTHTHHYGFFN